MKSKKIGAVVFVVIFFILSIFPSVGMLFMPQQEAVGNEHLAAKPALHRADGSLNADVLSDVTAYVGDHVAFRHEMITLNSRLNGALFGAVNNDDVVLGRDGWLYYSATLDDYQGAAPMSGRELAAAGRTLYLMQEYCQQNGVEFLFTIAPNKNSLYPQQMPGRYQRSGKESNAQRLGSLLRENGVAYADLFKVFRAEDEVLYFETDSHWNTRGAALAGDTLGAALGRGEAAVFDTPYTWQRKHKGDLYEMIYPAGNGLEKDAVYEAPFTFTYAQGYRTPEDITIHTSNPEKGGSLLMFRDSFGNSLHPFMAQQFGAACFSRAMPYNLTFLERENADTLVIEIVERNLGWLNTRAPIMPAPVRDMALSEAENNIKATGEMTSDDSGYIKLAGNIICRNMDDDSSIWLRCADGTVYEATPAGDGDKPFTLYLPADAQYDGAEIWVMANGAPAGCVLEISETTA